MALRLTISFALLLFAAGSSVTAQPLKVGAKGPKVITLSDKVGKNQFQWKSTAPLENIEGTADGVTGTITLDPTNVATLRGELSVPVVTLKSGNKTRDEHIRAATWLDAERYPTIQYKVSEVKNITVKGNSVRGTAVGEFSLHGVVKMLEVPFTLTYLDASPKTKARAAGDLVTIGADFSVALRDFNVAGSNGTIGSKVGEKIELKATLFGSTEN